MEYALLCGPVCLCACEYIKIGRHRKCVIVVTTWVRRAGVICPLLCVCVVCLVLYTVRAFLMFFCLLKKGRLVVCSSRIEKSLGSDWGYLLPRGVDAAFLHSLCRDAYISEHVCARTHTHFCLVHILTQKKHCID